MDAVTVSSKFQVVIPKRVRKALNIRPGQKMQVIEYGKHIVMIPIRSIKDARGWLKGIDTDPNREKEDREI
jgi:AbrB family looped-hinge helix DNA binding protein